MNNWRDQPRARGHALLASVTATRPQTTPATDKHEGQLTPAATQVLITAALQPGIFLVQLYTQLKLHPAEGKRAVTDLQARNLVKMHRLPRRGRGGQPSTLEVRKAGRAELAQRGITPTPPLVPRGGFCHSIIASWVKEQCETTSSRISIEVSLGGKCFDLIEETPSGELRGWEICYSGDTTYNTNTLARGARVAGIARVIGVFANRALMQRVARAIKAHEENAKIRVVYAGEYCPM